MVCSSTWVKYELVQSRIELRLKVKGFCILARFPGWRSWYLTLRKKDSGTLNVHRLKLYYNSVITSVSTRGTGLNPVSYICEAATLTLTYGEISIFLCVNIPNRVSEGGLG